MPRDKRAPPAPTSAAFGVHSVEGMICDQEEIRDNGCGKTEGPCIRFTLSPLHSYKEYGQDNAKEACALKYTVGD